MLQRGRLEELLKTEKQFQLILLSLIIEVTIKHGFLNVE